MSKGAAGRVHDRLGLLLAACACAMAGLGIWLADGLLNTRAGGDSPFLLIRTAELSSALADGAFPVRWMAESAFGLGYPFFVYYAALPYYFAAVAAVIGVPLLQSIKLVQTFGIIAAALGMYGLARRWLPSHGAALAAVAYTTAPFHLANIYVRGDSLSEFWAFVWFPLILSSLSTENRRHIFWLPALPLSALVLTHNVSAMLFAPFIVAWVLPDLIAQRRAPRELLRRIFELAAPALLAVGLSAWFWLPALGESAQAQLGEQTSGYFNYANHFRTLDVCAPALFTTSCGDRPVDQIPLVQSTLFADAAPPHAFAMGLLQSIAVAIGAAFWLRRDGARRPHRVVVLFIIATLGMTALSAPVWATLHPLQLAQFPWRLLSVQALFSSLLIGAIGAGATRFSNAAAALTSLVLIVSIAPLTTRVESLRVPGSGVTPRAIQLFEWYSGIVGTTIRAEYLPGTVQPAPTIGPDLLGRPRRALIAQDGIPLDALDSEVLVLDTDSQTWRISVRRDHLAFTLPILYTPAWEALNLTTGASVPMQPYRGSGWAQLELPRGEHTIMLRYAGTPLQLAGEIVSLIALVLLIGIIALTLRRTGLPSQSALRRAGAATLAFVIALAAPIFAQRLIMRRSAVPAQGEFVDFVQRPFVHSSSMTLASAGIEAELIDAIVEPHALRAGDEFTLTLRWRNSVAAPLDLVQELPSSSQRFDFIKHGRERSTIHSMVSSHRTPSEALPGPLLLMLVPSEGWSTSTNEAHVLGKTGPGLTLIGPTVTDTPPNAPATHVAIFENGIRAHVVDWLRPDVERICFRARWSRSGDVNRADALYVSYKLLGADDRLIAQADGQPQQGLAPTWSWLDDVVVADSRCVRAVDPQQLLREDEPYRVDITWYRLLDMQPTGRATLGGRTIAVEGAVNVTEPLP
jgi:hypothetical protein